MITHKVGEIFQFENEFLQVTLRNGCTGCFFQHRKQCHDKNIRSEIGSCSYTRSDGKSVQFINIETFK